MPMSNEVITHKHELQLLQSRISTSYSHTQHSGSCAVWDAIANGNKRVVKGFGVNQKCCFIPDMV